MENDEKLDLIESILQIPNGSLTEEIFLEDIDEWTDEGISNFQMELQERGKMISFDDLKECERVAELCRFFD